MWFSLWFEYGRIRASNPEGRCMKHKKRFNLTLWDTARMAALREAFGLIVDAIRDSIQP
jgi:hypothetical protein